VLSSSGDGWIAWNIDDEYVGSSKKLRELFGIKQSSNIYMVDILSSIELDDAENLSLNFNRLKKLGTNFKLSAKTISDGNRIEINGSRMIINGLETILLWCSDITKSAGLITSMKQKLDSAEQTLNSMYEILDALPMPIWRRNKNLKIVYCNKTYSDYLNTSVEKILTHGMPLVAGTLFGQGHSLAENAKKSNRPQSISQSIVVNGIRKKIFLRECPTVGENFVGYATDITAEETLTTDLDRIMTANYEVLENLSTAIVIFGENTKVVFFNSAYQRLMKLEAGWLHSKPTYAEVLDELRNNRHLAEQADYQAFKKSQLALFTSVITSTQELTYLPDGKTLRLTMAPYPLGGLLFTYEDVTDSLALQRKNNTLLAVQRETINNLYEGIMVYGSDNRLKIVNNAILRIWCFDKSEPDLRGMHISEILDHIKDELDYGSDWKEFRENAVSNLTDRITKTGKLIKKNGSTVLFSYIPLPDGAHMHSFIDITDAYEVEKAVKEKNQALKTAQDSRLEFVSGISTELKEPLSALIGFAELLFNQYFGTLNKKQLEYCQYILGASNQLCQLVNDLQEMVSIDIDSTSLNLSSFPMEDTIEEVLGSLEKRINEKSINVIKNYPEQKTTFHGDKTRIKQSIYNILTNIMLVTPPSGKINIMVTVDDKELKIVMKSIEYSRGENWKIFKRSVKRNYFFSSEDEGISMPFVKSLIELHGGTLKINSNVEEGTCVICALPISSQRDSKVPFQRSNTINFQQVINS
jgi:signal transduction histidine kinase